MTLLVGVMAAYSVILLTSIAWSQTPGTWEPYLERPRGPYRGQVVDADTGAPLGGAVVVAHWSRDRIYPFHSVMEHYAVREVVTGADGVFMIDAKEIEERAPKRTWYPEFLIFTPGYGSYPRFHKAPTGFIGGVFEGAGVVVQLPRLEGREERRKHLLRISPMSFTEKPFTDVPELMKKINEERISIGLKPFSELENQ
jgi:hypothetical protein